MNGGAVHIDLSELVANPLRTGIQRVEREALRHWAGPARPVPCCFDARGRLLRLPDAVLDALCAPDDGSPRARQAERLALERCVEGGEPLAFDAVERLLNLELFFDEARAEAYVRLAGSGVRLLWYLYDFLPFLRPELFAAGTTRHCMYFLRALRGVKHLAFLSERTRSEYASRIARAPLPAEWPVLHPGADGLGLERQSFDPRRRHFLSIGTVEPRKNQLAMLRGFETLWDRGVDAKLVVAGHISPDAVDERASFARHAGDPRLVVLDRPSDDVLRTLLRGARAVIMPSEAEGFGLPPYEALHAGVPSVVSERLPGLALMPAGVVRLPAVTPDAIAASVTALLDDGAAARLWQEAAGVGLPTWRGFGRDLSNWAQAA